MKRLISGVISAAMLFGAAVILPGAVAVEIPVLRSDSRLITTKDGSAVCGTGGPITASELAAEFDGNVTVKGASGSVIADDKNVPTGSKIQTENGGELPVIISGDANGDGNVNLSDVTAMLKYIANWDVEVDNDAARVSGGQNVSITDVSTVLKYIAKWDVKLGNMKVVVDEDPQIAAAEDSGIKLWFDHSTEKLARKETDSTGKNTYVIYAAKNEIEDANLYISPDKDYKDVSISMSSFVNCWGDTVDSEAYSFYYHWMGDDVYRPDALIPAGYYNASVSSGNSQGFLIKAKTTEETVAGLYEATVSIKSGTSEVKRAKVYLNVWDFTLDDADACDTSFGLSKREVIIAHNYQLADNDTTVGIYKKYYDYFLENRINACNLPYDILSDEADEYLNDPRVRSFLIAGTGYGGEYDRTIEQVEAYYEKLSNNPEWFDKGYFYYVDEPFTQEKFDAMVYYKEYLEQHYPGGKSMIPFETSADVGLNAGIYDLLYNYCDIYCPKIYAYTPEKYRGMEGVEMFLTAADTAKYGSYEDVINGLVENGEKEAWWYHAGRPFEPYVTFHADSKGILARIAGWQQKQYNVTGLLYYLVNNYLGDPINSLNYTIGDGRIVWGGGILVYPGRRFGIDGPVGSIRVEHIRDGIEDYMYLTMAERLIGEEKTDELIRRVTRDLLDYDADSDLVLSVRAEIAELIMEAQAK